MPASGGIAAVRHGFAQISATPSQANAGAIVSDLEVWATLPAGFELHAQAGFGATARIPDDFAPASTRRSEIVGVRS